MPKNLRILLKFIYSEKVTKFCEISTVDLTGTTYIGGQIYGGDFANFCGLLRIYELYTYRKLKTVKTSGQFLLVK